MASERKSRRFEPNLRRASSAASSAFCKSFRRFAASPRSRERTVSDSWIACSEDMSLVVVGVVSEASPASAVVAGCAEVFRESDRVRLMMVSRRSVKPRVAS